ncbi:MAG: hypothetical protein H8D48_02175 [Actinobacteria bacterium]|nr:hypothetical protein [Actinomycetota bacterium]
MLAVLVAVAIVAAACGSDGAEETDRHGFFEDALVSAAVPSVIQIAGDLAYGHACALFSNGGVKCWGEGDYGELGRGDTDYIGDEPMEMGAFLPYVDLGTGRTATAITTGEEHSCALLDGGDVKCWGNSEDWGASGQGYEGDIGEEPGEMGDSLAVIDLGTGLTAVAIAAGSWHNCAILDDGSVKCWGYNEYAALGLGRLEYGVGESTGEMGDALPVVDLGTGRTAKAIEGGEWHTCAILDNDDLKCWGYDEAGELGYPDIISYDNDPSRMIGDVPGEMGDALPAVDLGVGLTVVQVSGGDDMTCALFSNTRVKCWGENDDGELGLGDDHARGNHSGEMGDALPFLDFGTGADGNPLGALAVAAGDDFGCVILIGGDVKCWGENNRGVHSLPNRPRIASMVSWPRC